ncbi:MAG: glutathione peroxidase [Polyangiales bacterium]
MAKIHEFTMDDLTGRPVDFKQFEGKVLLVVNTASKCGFTPQYKGLEALHKKLNDKGLEILGFPCNQFGQQEPGGADEIATFCERNYGVSFKMFSKIDVNGPTAAPLYQYLKHEAPGLLGTESIKWNFTKFLIDRSGKIVRRYGPNDTPEAIEKDIAALL